MLASTTIFDSLIGQPALLVGLGIVVIGLLVIGLRDVSRFSLVRVAAIASVCFRQSIRRRVLWITPLVIMGVMVVSQFQKPGDAQDAIRQTTSYCLFATGLLVALVTIILACTNLPREIETRVIYTVATKPTTRLEIIVGKVAGFAAVSFWILVIMGFFTYGYLQYQDWHLRRAIAADLAAPMADVMSRATQEYYRDAGTLHARHLGLPSKLSLLSHRPATPDDLWVPGPDGEILARFIVDRALIPAAPDAPPTLPAMGPMLDSAAASADGLIVSVNLRARPIPEQSPALATQPTTAPARQLAGTVFDLRNSRNESLILHNQMDMNQAQPLPGGKGSIVRHIPAKLLEKWITPGSGTVEVIVAALALSGAPVAFEYTATVDDFSLIIPVGDKPVVIKPYAVEMAARRGTDGQQLRGGGGNRPRVAIYQFRDQAASGDAKNYTFELRMGIESGRDDTDVQEDVAITSVYLDIVNNKTGAIAKDVRVFPESNRPSYLEVPAAAVAGGDFDVILRMSTPGYAGLRSGPNASLKMVVAQGNFAVNLLKSLAILWLMSLLVTVIAIFCSTFLSWPIAVVFTLVILSGRWGTEQLGDLTQPGIGRQVVQDMFRGSDAATSRAVSESVDELVRMLNRVSMVLPNISRFSAIEDIQRGVAISWSTFFGALQVTFGFGIPLVVLSYIFLKYKEVAP